MIRLRLDRAAAWRGLGALGLSALLSACSSPVSRPDPQPLPPNPNLLGVRQIWRAASGPVSFPLVVQAAGPVIGVAADDGMVSLLDARTGDVLWRAGVGAQLTAGVGHDGRQAAVVTVDNQLVVLQDGRELWRQRLSVPSYTAPLVAGARVFVLGADRSVSAYDGQSGRRLWNQSRTGEALVLRQPGVLTAVGDTLVVGLSGRLVGLNPLNGSSRWEVPVASPRGTNDVERLVDLVAGVNRQGSMICARAFQAAVGCVDAARGTLVWSKPAAGASGLSGDDRLVLGVEFNGTLVAWRAADGERVWSMNQLRYRRLTAPLLVGQKLLVVGDDEGRLHFYASADGALQGRYEIDPPEMVVSPLLMYENLPTYAPASDADLDQRGLAAAPVLAGNTLVVVTRGGRVLGLRPE